MRLNALTASSWCCVCSQMINDPEYMRAAKKKLDEMQRTAQDAGLLDQHGNPLPGAATAAGKKMPAAAQMMAQMMAAQGMQQRASPP